MKVKRSELERLVKENGSAHGIYLGDVCHIYSAGFRAGYKYGYGRRIANSDFISEEEYNFVITLETGKDLEIEDDEPPPSAA